MKLKWRPKRSLQNERIHYNIDGTAEIITARIGEVEDVFDFSGLPDGELDVSSLETTLPINPIRRAWRENGVLSVELLYWHGPPDETPEEIRFPEWQEVV